MLRLPQQRRNYLPTPMRRPPPSVAMPVAPPRGTKQPRGCLHSCFHFFRASGLSTIASTNKGLIHIAIFASIILGLSSDLDGGFKAMLGILLGGFIFYTAFEAMQTAQAKNRGEIPPDPLESWSKDRPIGAIILIGLGVLFLLDNFSHF